MISSSRFGSVSAVSLAAVVLGSVLLQIAGGALNIFVPIVMAVRHDPPLLVGLVTAASSAGFLIGCFISGKLSRRVGHIRAFAVFAAGQSIFALSLALFQAPEVWVVVRFCAGFIGAGLSITVDSWINGRLPQARRGQVLAAYYVITRLAAAVGQAWPAITMMPAELAFIVMAMLYCMALIPVSLTQTRAPKNKQIMWLDVGVLWQQTPISVVASLYSGLTFGALAGILPVYGLMAGLSTSSASVLTVTVQMGALLLQWPLGFASDKIDRRRVMLMATLATCLVHLLMLVIAPGDAYLLYALFALAGGLTLPIYSIGSAHAFDKFGGGGAVGLASSLLFLWGLGAAIGPLAVSGALQLLGTAGLHVYLALLAGLFVGLTAWRLTAKGPPPRLIPFAASSQNSPVIGRTDEEGSSDRTPPRV